MTGLTLDAGALIAIDKGSRRVFALITRTAREGHRINVPATALAQVIRDRQRQARLSKFIRQATTTILPLDEPDALAVGKLLAATGTADIADAHVVVCAARLKQTIVTSDPRDIRRLAPHLELLVV